MIETKEHLLDNLDRKIISILSKDAKIPYTEVAKSLAVSSGTIHGRMRRMEELGIIKGARLELNYAMLGYDITAFLGIYLQKSSFYGSVLEKLRTIPEIVNIYYTTGNYSMFVKMYCKNTKDLKETLHSKIQQIEGIERTETTISLEESLNNEIDFSCIQN